VIFLNNTVKQLLYNHKPKLRTTAQFAVLCASIPCSCRPQQFSKRRL